MGSKKAAMNKLKEHIQQLSVEIGPRPAGSVAEHAAARYVEAALESAGLAVQKQPAHILERFSKRLMPQFIASALTILFGNHIPPILREIIGAAELWHYRHIMQGRPALWEKSLSWRVSHNLITCIPPQQAPQRQIVLITSLSSELSRPSFSPNMFPILPWLLSGSQAAIFAGSNLSSKSPKWLRYSLSGFLFGMGVLTMLDELGDPIEGANGNAAAASILLELGEKLAKNPPMNTEVWLVFTGGTSLDKFLHTYGDQLRDAYFVLLDHVGAGQLCWVTDHSLDPLVHYYPHSETVNLIEQTAKKHPHFGVMGKSMCSLDDLGIIQAHGMKSVCLMGYDRISGHPTNRFRDEDIADSLESESIQNTLDFLQALIG